MAVAKRVADRIASGLKSYQGIVESLRSRDVSEADTVTVIKDLLSDVFGYDKYLEITGEYAIRGTYCDLAVKLDGKMAFLIEVKAIGLDLAERHTKQAVDYAANQGVEWVVLTNGCEWILYHVLFRKPIDKREIAKFDIRTVDPKREEDVEKLYLLTREGFLKSAMAEYRDRREAMSRYMLAAILTSVDQVVAAIRREVRRSSGLSIDTEEIVKTLREQVIKRDALEGDEAAHAAMRLKKALQRPLRTSRDDQDGDDQVADSPAAAPPTPKPD